MEAKGAEFKNQFGNTVENNSAVVPLISQDVNTKESFFIGTAFFVSGSGILMTAKHNLFDKGNKIFDNLSIVHFLPENKYMVRPIHNGAYNTNYDIAYMLPGEMLYKGKPYFNASLILSDSVPEYDDQLGMFAYPESRISYKLADPGKMEFNSKFYLGNCREYHPDGFSLLKNPCYQTNIQIPSGASGGPVFDKNGYVFAVASTGFDLSDGGEEISFVTPIVSSFSLELIDATLKPRTVQDLINTGIINFKTSSSEDEPKIE